MRYAEYGPSAPLVPLVETYWVLEGAPAGAADAVIPDGRIELVFHFGGPFWRHPAGGEAVRQPTTLLVGQMIEPVVLEPQDVAGVAAIRLRPAAARMLFGFAMHEVSGRFVELEAIFPSARRVTERLNEVETDRERVSVLEAWLLAIARWPSRPQVEAVVEAILATSGRASISALAAHAETSVRQVERQFLSDVGMTPKTFARIVRLQAALRHVRDGRPLDDVALACGYFDQAHMSRDFRELAAMSPGAWRAHQGDLAKLFVGAPTPIIS